jgi:hypothetical protein
VIGTSTALVPLLVIVTTPFCSDPVTAGVVVVESTLDQPDWSWRV